MAQLQGSVSIFDGDGGETAAEGELRVTTGDDPGTVAIWIGIEPEQAGLIVDNLENFKARVAAL